jgi:hypothetical protein
MAVRIRVFVTATRRGAASLVRVVWVASPPWRTVFIARAATAIVPITTVIEITRGSPASIVIPTRAVATGRTATIIEIIIWRWRVPTTPSGRAGSVPVTSPVIWPSAIGSARLEWRGWGWIAHFLDASDLLTLELAAVQFLYSGLQVLRCLIFDEARKKLVCSISYAVTDSPSTVALTTDFRVDNIKARLAGEIFQVLENRG